MPPREGSIRRLQLLPALDERQLDQRLRVELEQVEDDEDERARAVLEEREPCAARLVERADLRIEDGVRRAGSELRSPGGWTKALRQIVSVPARERRLTTRDRHERAEAVPLRLVHPALSTGQALGRRREHRRVPARRGRRAVLAEQQPVLRIAVELGGHERPDAVQPLAVEPDGEPSVPLLLQQLVGAAIPDLNGAGAVLAGRDRALEVAVLERVILDVNREMPFTAPQRDALRHRPARERTVPLETEVVVQPARVVALDDEARLLGTALLRAERLGRLSRSAFPAIFVERHLWIVAINATRSSPTGSERRNIPAHEVFRIRG